MWLESMRRSKLLEKLTAYVREGHNLLHGSTRNGTFAGHIKRVSTLLTD